jgi:hypothetical protein
MPFETSWSAFLKRSASWMSWLDPGAFEDYALNGLQVPGAASVTKVDAGVSAQRELIRHRRRVRRHPESGPGPNLGSLDPLPL